MKLTAFSAVLAAAVAFSANAIAQTTPQNVPDSQSLCAGGYDSAASAGRLSGSGMSQFGKGSVDTNRDGTISKTEFENACSKNMLQRSEQNKGN